MKALIMALALGTSLAQAEDANPLIAERWKSRPLIVIAPDPNDTTLLEVRQALSAPDNREAFVDREMVLYEVVAGQGSRNGQALAAQASAALLKALGHAADGEARVVLVGKDGSVKVDQSEPFDPRALFRIIDRMPMRQAR